MTQEEKAKAYDKAIEKIKYVMEHGVSPVLNKEDLEDIFPELKESEDEKVEKAIFGMVYDSDNELWSSYGVSKGDVLAWLEKHGEQKPKWSEEDEMTRKNVARERERLINKACDLIDATDMEDYFYREKDGKMYFDYDKFLTGFRRVMEANND